MEIRERFEQYEDEFMEFGRIKDPPHLRPDVCAFIVLDRLVPPPFPKREMVCAAEHDEIYLDVDPAKLTEVASDDDIKLLVRCGVRYDESTDSLAMFV